MSKDLHWISLYGYAECWERDWSTKSNPWPRNEPMALEGTPLPIDLFNISCSLIYRVQKKCVNSLSDIPAVVVNFCTFRTHFIFWLFKKNVCCEIYVLDIHNRDWNSCQVRVCRLTLTCIVLIFSLFSPVVAHLHLALTYAGTCLHFFQLNETMNSYSLL